MLHNGLHNAKKLLLLKAICFLSRNTVFSIVRTNAKTIDRTNATLPSKPT